MLKEYNFAMIVKLKPSELSNGLKAKYNIDMEEKSARLGDQYQDINKMSSSIWSDFSGHYKNSLMDLLELERAAFNRGYTFATVFFAGRCLLCEECDVKSGLCRNPVIARFSAESMGINLSKTAENAGMELKFHTEDNSNSITPMAILLID